MQQLQVIAKIEDANTNINGSTITTSATGKQMIEVNQTNTNGTVTLPSANTVVINNPGNGWSRIKYVSNTNFFNESNGNINLSSISQVVMTTEPLITALNASTVGTVTSTVTLPLNQLPTGVTLTQSITEGANVSVRNAFQLSATDNNLNFGAVAYTVQFQNTALINANLTGAADPVQLNMSVLHSWVVANGPTTDKIKIMRIADDGQRSMLTTRYLGSSADTLTDFFECDSPNGLSTFGVVSVSSTGGGGDSGSGGGIGGDSGSVAPALASPSTIAVNVGGNSAINKVTVTGTGVNNIIVTALPHAVLPGSIPPMATTVYQYIAVTPARYTTISSVTLNFNVPASWLADKGFTKNDIALMLWDPTAKTWSSLPTSIISESQGTITYQAIAPHMSEFAVAYQKGAASQANVTVIQMDIPLSAPTTLMTPHISIRPTSPTQTQTIAPAASTSPSSGTPLTTMVIAVVGIIIIVGGAFLVRRWWIRRQNPALFRNYD
jgi:PGF-pre-PGF domain-containing protein